MSGGKCFLDTNILVYAADQHFPEKRKIAISLIDSLYQSERLVVSTQVIREFCNAAIKKLGVNEQSLRLFTNMYYDLPPFQESKKTLMHALKIYRQYQYSLYDSLILASAIETGCVVLYSEDLQNGQIIEGTKITDPFNH